MDNQRCPLCGRELGSPAQTSRHHLIPKSEGGGPEDMVELHNICHQKIHSLFSERELKDYYHSIARLHEHEDIQKFVRWVRRKHPDFYQYNRRKKR